MDTLTTPKSDIIFQVYPELVLQHADTVEAMLAAAYEEERYVTDGNRSITFIISRFLLSDPVKDELVRRAKKVGLAVSFVNTDVTQCFVTMVNIK